MSLYLNIVKLVSEGKRVRCSRSGTYFHIKDTNPDGKGGRVAKIFDYLVHRQWEQKSKDQEGPGYWRGSTIRINKFSNPQQTYFLQLYDILKNPLCDINGNLLVLQEN